VANEQQPDGKKVYTSGFLGLWCTHPTRFQAQACTEGSWWWKGAGLTVDGGGTATVVDGEV
jgi:hypothetical protein